MANSEKNMQPQDSSKQKKSIHPGLEQVSLEQYKELYQKQIEKRKKKKKMPAAIKMALNFFYILLAGLGVLVLGFFAFSFIKAIVSG